MRLPVSIREQINNLLERVYPEEGAGFLLGCDYPQREVTAIVPLANDREEPARRSRYLIGAVHMLLAEKEAERQQLDVIGVYHSHPDHPSRPSDFDREWALPWFSYLIVSVVHGRADACQCWRLREDRSGFDEEAVLAFEGAGAAIEKQD